MIHVKTAELAAKIRGSQYLRNQFQIKGARIPTTLQVDESVTTPCQEQKGGANPENVWVRPIEGRAPFGFSTTIWVPVPKEWIVDAVEKPEEEKTEAKPKASRKKKQEDQLPDVPAFNMGRGE